MTCTLPECSWRTLRDDGRATCGLTSKVRHGPNGFNPCKVCLTCVFINHPTNAPQPPPLPPQEPAPAHGPGTELKRLLAMHGMTPKGCACDARAAEMNRRGPDWCEANIQTIVDWMKEEADRRGLLFWRPYARWLVRRAVRASR
jgi:hypothetical protein